MKTIVFLLAVVALLVCAEAFPHKGEGIGIGGGGIAPEGFARGLDYTDFADAVHELFETPKLRKPLCTLLGPVGCLVALLTDHGVLEDVIQLL